MPASASMWILGKFLGFSTAPGRITRRRLSLDRRARVNSEIFGRGPLRRREKFGGGQPVSIKLGAEWKSCSSFEAFTRCKRIRWYSGSARYCTDIIKFFQPVGITERLHCKPEKLHYSLWIQFPAFTIWKASRGKLQSAPKPFSKKYKNLEISFAFYN